MANVLGRPRRDKNSLNQDADQLDAAHAAGIAMESLAREIGVSASYLHRVRKRKGKGLSRIKRGRLDRFLESKNLLAKGQMSLNLTTGETVEVSSDNSPLKMSVIQRRENLWLIEVRVDRSEPQQRKVRSGSR
jgi:hypothetical protein